MTCDVCFVFTKERSAFRFPTAMNKLRKKVQIMSHGLSRISSMKDPAIALITKFVEIKIISAKISSLKYKEYNCVRKKNIKRSTKKISERKEARIKDSVARRIARKTAKVRETSPEARGRPFFSGCALSFSLSMISFNI